MVSTGFLLHLYQSGRVRLPATPTVPAPELIDGELSQLDSITRISLASNAPQLHLPTARWAAILLYGAICCYAFRDWGAERVEQILSTPLPARGDASPAELSYSADLSLQFLPDLYLLARGIAPGDPLIVRMLQIARDWPLSSVGMAEVDIDPALDISAFIEDPSLRTLYLDRIIARKATARLANPQIARFARAAIGLHGALAPEIASFLKPSEDH